MHTRPEGYVCILAMLIEHIINVLIAAVSSEAKFGSSFTIAINCRIDIQQVSYGFDLKSFIYFSRSFLAEVDIFSVTATQNSDIRVTILIYPNGFANRGDTLRLAKISEGYS